MPVVSRLAGLALSIAALGSAGAEGADGAVTGTAVYRERIALPPGAVFEATLEDVSLADATAEVLGRARVARAGQVPIAFAISYDPAGSSRGTAIASAAGSWSRTASGSRRPRLISC